MCKIVYLFCAIVMMLVLASPADAFGGLLGLRRNTVVVNNFTTGIGSQVAFVQSAPVFVPQPVFVPTSTIVVNRGVALRSGVDCDYSGGVSANVNLRGGVRQQQVIRQRTVIR